MFLVVLMSVGVGFAVVVLKKPLHVAATTTPTVTPTLSSVTEAPTPLRVTDTPTPVQTMSARGFSTIPDTFFLPHENDGDWYGANWTPLTCSGSRPQDGTVRQATDVRTIRTLGANSRSESLFLTADTATARQIFYEISTAVGPCRSDDPDIPEPVSTRHPVDGQWQQSGIFTLTFPGESGPVGTSVYTLVAQSGRAVIVMSIEGEDVPAPKKGVPDDTLVQELQAFADELRPQLCIFYDEGCPLPVVAPNGEILFPQGSLNMPDGTVRLPDGSIYNAAGTLLTPAPSSPPPETPTAPVTP